MSEKPLPCPFCGCEPLIGQTLDNAWYAMCIQDHCCKLESYWRTEAEALTAWNTRAAMQADAAPVAWMPIETAPKDGTEIILWPGIRHPVDGVIPPAVGAWHKYRELECWDDLAVGHHNGFWKPTHWMPLPATPVDNRVSTSSPVDDRAAPETSVKLRDALAVWLEAAHTFKHAPPQCKLEQADQAAAAVIEADREAVRAEQAAYLAKARKEAGQNHDLHMAAVNEVVDLKAELAKFKALAETLAGALEAIRSEAQREEGSWLHLKRCIAAQAAETLHQYNEATQ